MSEIALIDVSLRDGNQSLWGMVGVTTRMTAGAAPLLERVGYHAVEAATSTQMAVDVRFHKQDPWARIRAMRAAMPTTPLGFLTTGKRFITFSRTPDTIFAFAFDLLRRSGVRRMWVVDPMHDMTGAKRIAAMAKRAGFDEVIGGICYTTSPVHTDAYFADKIAQWDECPHIDGIYLKDPAGLLTPERVRSLIPALQSRLRVKVLDEIHSHCNTGLAPLTVLEAADLGVTKVHCALPPLANGSSHPSAPRLVANLRARGHDVRVDLNAMADASAYLTRQARLKALPAGVPAEYDEDYYRHNIPGGVLSTLARQLGEIRRPELLAAVKEEAVRVRADMGWPIVVTPFAQYIVTQATLNVISGERYAQLADEIVDLLRGDFGPLPGAVSQNLLDRAMSSKRAERDLSPPQPTIAGLRARFGARLSDEDLLLRAVMPAEQVDAMVAARENDPVSFARVALEPLRRSSSVKSLAFRRGPMQVIVQRGSAGVEP